MSSSTNGPAKNQFKNIFVTGATDGLGRAIAIMLAEEGFRVFAAGRDAQKRAALEQFAEEHELPLETLPLDVTRDDSVKDAVAEAERRAGSIDVLVNNAGIAIAAVMEEISIADLRKQFETNIFGVIRVTQRVLPGMRKRRLGRIVNMSSIAGHVSNPLMGPYSASKHALEAISDAMRLEVASFGIRVVLIEPGIIPTNINRAGAELSSQYLTNAAESPYAPVYFGFLRTWQKRVAAAKTTPEECARVVLEAIRAESPRARYRVTREAKITIAMRWLLSDRQLDRLSLRMLGLDGQATTPPEQAQIQEQLQEMIRTR